MLSLESTMLPPVGKSGPLTHFTSDFDLASGLSIRCSAASHSSAALCGGIEVAMPTALPWEPLASRLREAPRKAMGAVGAQVREAAGQHRRLFALAVVIRAELDAVLVDALQQQLRD